MLTGTQDNEEIIGRVAALDIGKAEIAPFAAAVAKLDEISGISLAAGHAVIAEIGLDMARFPTAGHLARYTDLGSGFYASRTDPDHRRRNHVRQIEALGYKVILERAA